MAKAVIFDMDGVLIDSELIYLEWLIDYLNQRGYIVDREQLEQSIGLSSELTIELMEKIYGTGRALWEDFLKVTASYPLDYNDILFDGIKELVEYLAEKRVRLAIASASPRDEIEEMLKETGLSKWIQVVLSGEELKESKPNPEIYLVAAEKLDVDIKKCIIVEDSKYGIEAGKRAGAYVIARKEERFACCQERADKIVENIEELRRFLSKML